MASHRPAMMAKAVAAASITDEVLVEQYGTLNLKDLFKTETANTNNSKPTQN